MSTEPDPRSTVTGVVLAGGRGVRMRGCDKGLIERDGRTLVQHQLDALAPQVAALMVSANRNLAEYRKLDVPIVVDTLPDFPGPLAGMAAAAAVLGTEWMVCVPCDTLALPSNLVERLIDAAQRAGVGAAYAHDVDGPQFVVCALRATLADALAQAAASPRRAVRDFLQGQHAVAVRFDGWRCANLNTPEMLEC